MVGNINKTNPICFYHGKIRSIRISKNQRYAADFEPGQTFGPKIPPFSSTRLSRLMAMPCETCRDISTTAGSSGSERHRFRIAPIPREAVSPCPPHRFQVHVVVWRGPPKALKAAPALVHITCTMIVVPTGHV